MSPPWAKVHTVLGGERLRWQSIIVPTHPKYKIKEIGIFTFRLEKVSSNIKG